MSKNLFKKSITACMVLIGAVSGSAAAEAPVIHGNIVGPAAWVDYVSGIYSFKAEAPLTLEMQKESRFIAVNGGGDNVGGMYHYISNNDGLGLGDTYRMYLYDAATWIPRNNFKVPGNWHATDMAYDRTTGRLYGSFTTDNSLYYFGWMDPLSGEFTSLRRCGGYNAVAADAYGCIFAINGEGQLMMLDKSTGEETVVFDTKLPSAGSQSACIDPQTRVLYWCRRDAEDQTALYSVDISADAPSVSLVGDFPQDEVVTGAYIEPVAPDADTTPAAVADLSVTVSADGEGYTAKVSFTLPSATVSGLPLKDNIAGCMLAVDGVRLVPADGAPGSAMEFTFNGLAECMHMASVTIGGGEPSTVYFFVGNDTPKAVTDLTAMRSADTFRATWTAPEGGVNGGAVDPSKLTYEVTFHKGDASEVTTIAETHFETTVTAQEPTQCYVEVKAIAENLTSASLASNKVLMGPGYKLPYTANFSEGAGVEDFLIVDANGDGCTWYFEDLDEDMRTQYKSGYGKMDDWLFTPGFDLATDSYYHVQVKVATAGISYPETLEIRAGMNRLPDEMIMEVTPPVEYATPGQTVDAYLIPTEDGQWYVGFHAMTEGQNLYVAIDNVKIERGGLLTTPATPADVMVTPGAGGALNATLEFTAPSLCLDGMPLEENITVQIYRSGRRLKQIDDVVPGSKVKVEGLTGSQGYNTYEVRCLNSDGYGIPATVKTYLGVDVPLSPKDVCLTFDSEGRPVISWSAPEAGEKGGVLNAEALTYSVRRSFDGQYVAENIKGMSAVDELGLVDGVDQALMFYRVYAHSAAGTSQPAESEHFTMGKPYGLPWSDSFKDALEMKGPWLGVLLDNQKGCWYIDAEGSRPNADPVDGDGGVMTFAPGEAGQNCTLTTPMVCIDDAEYPVAEFYIYATSDNDSRLTVSVRTGEGEPEPVWTRLMSDASFTPGWNVVRIPLDAYKGEKYVQVMFHGLAGEAYYNHMHIDRVSISDRHRYDVAAGLLTVPDAMVPGEPAGFTATVANVGVDDVADVKVSLLRSGKEVASETISRLAASASVDVVLTDVADLSYEAYENYSFTVSAPTDGNIENDASAVKEVIVELPHYPVPVLQGYKDGDKAVLTWKRPATEGVRAPVTDGFESYAPFIIDNVGDWTMHDIDGTRTIGLLDSDGNPYEYENAGAKMAYQVFNPGEAGLPLVDEDGLPTLCAPHRGAQMMCAFCDLDLKNDDWLVSPRLTGEAQDVMFYAKSYTDNYGLESMIIMISYTGTAVEDFQAWTPEVEVPVDWTRYILDIPEGARYFAIRCTSVDKFALCIDDVKLIPESSAPVDLVLTGYNLYRDGVLLQTLGPDATSAEVAVDGARYRLSALYHLGESAHSAEILVDELGGVDNVTVGSVESATSDIYTMQGILLKRAATEADIRALAPGIYIIGGEKRVIR